MDSTYPCAGLLRRTISSSWMSWQRFESHSIRFSRSAFSPPITKCADTIQRKGRQNMPAQQQPKALPIFDFRFSIFNWRDCAPTAPLSKVTRPQGPNVYYHPFLYSGGVLRDLGNFDWTGQTYTVAWAINNRTQVVGLPAFIWDDVHGI